MARAFAREKKPEGLDTRDAFLARLLRTIHWMERNRRVVGLLALVHVAVGAAAFYYVDYRRDLAAQASAELEQIRLAGASQTPDVQRDLLATFLARYGDTRAAADARLLLAQLQLSRDSTEAAIRLLEPVAAALGTSPTAYAAATMLAAAHEQVGRPEEALRVYGTIAEKARFDFQRREALAAQARLHAADGRLREAEAIYRQLVAEGPRAGDPTAPADPYAVRLGEVRARLAAGGGADPAGPAPAGAEREAAERPGPAGGGRPPVTEPGG